MKHNHLILLVLGVAVLAIGSCMKNDHVSKRSPNLPATPYQYAVQVIVPPVNPYPNGGSTIPNTPTSNLTTNAGATLGRVLFYETLFSLNNSISCGSCHKQQNAFADNVAVSTGYENQKGTRNAIGLVNLGLNSNFFWDGRVNTLEAQVTMPVKNHAEMGMENLDNLVKKLQAVPYYPGLFNAAFGSNEITGGRISDALAQFLRAMQSFNSEFDQGSPTGFSNFTPQQLEGEATFREFHCNSCHGGSNLNNGGMGEDHDMPNGNDWSNSGLDVNFPDAGLMDVTSQPTDNGVFKVPSLRNVALTAPYMHDGRFQTLAQVVEHYNSGIQANPNLDFRLMQGSFDGSNSTAPVRMNMTANQKAALVAFLGTLTDNQFVTDPKFSDPFK